MKSTPTAVTVFCIRKGRKLFWTSKNFKIECRVC